VDVLVEEVDGDTENAEEEEYIEGSLPTSMNHEDEWFSYIVEELCMWKFQ
jgi:hypothetical protein